MHRFSRKIFSCSREIQPFKIFASDFSVHVPARNVVGSLSGNLNVETRYESNHTHFKVGQFIILKLKTLKNISQFVKFYERCSISYKMFCTNQKRGFLPLAYFIVEELIVQRRKQRRAAGQKNLGAAARASSVLPAPLTLPNRRTTVTV